VDLVWKLQALLVQAQQHAAHGTQLVEQVHDLEERVPPHHPLRAMKRFADGALTELSPTFDAMYGAAGLHRFHPSGC
jgi:hypothetical protein